MSQLPASTAFDAAFVDVLHFWFGSLSTAVEMPKKSIERQRWFGKDAAIDADIKMRFEPLYHQLVAALAAGWWPVELKAALAAIIVLDQFSRNMFRDTAEMYAADPAAQRLSREFSSHPQVTQLDLFQVMFLHMPLMHAENVADQRLMMGYFNSLYQRALQQASPNLSFFAGNIDYAARHLEIIERFGHFPHRNVIVGRITTPEEEAFFKENHSSF